MLKFMAIIKISVNNIIIFNNNIECYSSISFAYLQKTSTQKLLKLENAATTAFSISMIGIYVCRKRSHLILSMFMLYSS